MQKFSLLICALLIAFVELSGTSAWAMDLMVDGTTVTMSGTVTGPECDQLRDILSKNKITNVILTNSPGGDAEAGYCTGALIREKGIATSITGSCASSCSRMWLGGVTRTLNGKDARVGLHGNYGSTGALLETAPARLRAWIPIYAPSVDRDLMERWITLPINTTVMYFYNDRAEICEGRDCSPLPMQNAKKAGLLTQ